MQASAELKGWALQYFPAVYPPTNYEEFTVFKRCLKYKMNHQLVRGEVGCALSHLLLWEELANSDHDFYVIFEDDARFLAPPTELRVLMDVDFQMINKHSTAHQGGLWIGPKSSGLYGYVVTRSGAQKFLNLYREINLPIDIMVLKNSLLFGGPLRVAVSKAIVAHDNDLSSEIGNSRIVFSGRRGATG